MSNYLNVRWRLVSETVRGASHERSGLPNQDAIRFIPESGFGPAVVIAVSDGHGSSKCFRSDIGSALAVKIALETLQPLLSRAVINQATIKHLVEDQLARDLVKRWRLAVAEHLLANPVIATDPTEQTGENPFIVYGATLLMALATEKYLIYLQLGDGDIITVADDGKADRLFARDNHLLGNETTSLCMVEAWREMKVCFQPVETGLPALILISTDGYSNSFLDDQAFLRVGPDILEMIHSSGIEDVSGKLKDWLNEASRVGSGDDITLGLMYRTEAGANSTSLWDFFRRKNREKLDR
jgi:serine/threonine protein phosphatase PrpC